MSISRTHRPHTFSDIVGQQPITETLRLEISSGKLGHAYLFSGPRGVGKTTAARVFAKALNCLQPKQGEPCDACEACADFNESRAMDVIEMDAASNTGVDNIREAIIEHVRFAPHARAHKVYILDEAHMLSTSAWNALLKTLEEPPAYAVFLLLTTELHKVPATIQSRCQRFDFKKIPQNLLIERVLTLSKKEGVTLAPEVATTIAERSDGCLRDAESLLGQLLALGETNITQEVASLVLPVSRVPIATTMLTKWAERNLSSALQSVRELEEQGIPLLPMFDDLIQAVRQLIIQPERSTSYTPAELADIALMLMERRRDAKQGADVRFCLELAATAVAMSLLPHASGNQQPTTPAAPTKPAERPPETQRTETPKPPVATSNPAPSSQTTPTSSTSTLASISTKWPAIIRAIDEKSKALTFVMKLSQPIDLQGNVVTIQFQYSFHKEKVVDNGKTRQMVEDCIRAVMGDEHLRIEGVLKTAQDGPTSPLPTDMVSKILKAFEGNVVSENENGIA